MRRNPIYQEFLVTVLNLPNPYKYTAKELRHYRFGYFASPEVNPKSRAAFKHFLFQSYSKLSLLSFSCFIFLDLLLLLSLTFTHDVFFKPTSLQDKFPTMIPYGAESELLAAESVVNFITDDLIMVPRSQLRPDDSFPSPEDQAIGR